MKKVEKKIDLPKNFIDRDGMHGGKQIMVKDEEKIIKNLRNKSRKNIKILSAGLVSVCCCCTLRVGAKKLVPEVAVASKEYRAQFQTSEDRT